MFLSNSGKRNLFAYVKDDMAIAMVAKCGNSTIAAISAAYQGIQLYNDDENAETFKFRHLNAFGNKWSKIINNFLVDGDSIDKSKTKLIAIYRDPIERLISSYNPLGVNMEFDDYIKECINTLKYSKIHKTQINKHIDLQCTIYDPSIIVEFVELKDLSTFLNKHEIKFISQNITPYSIRSKYNCGIIEELKEELTNLYSEDYKMIKTIEENKLKFIP